MDARRDVRSHRRGRRIKTGATLVGGALAVAGLVWVSRAGPTEVELVSEPVRLGAATDVPDVIASVPASLPSDTEVQSAAADTATVPLATTPPEGVEMIVVRSAATDEALAGALVVRDHYLVTSGAALAGIDEIVVTWGDLREPATVVGHDDVTDVTVIRVDGGVPSSESGDATAREGDEIELSAEDGRTAVHKVVAEQSTSAMANGTPVVGIVELDGRLGDVAPGTPAYDSAGDVVGITTATADSAPAALVPIALAREVADEIIDDGEATHPWLGVTARNPGDGPGSLVTSVNDAGPAAAGGMVAGDLIVTIDGHTVESMAAMVATLRSYEPGDTVEIVVTRDDEPVNCTVQLASHLDVEA